MAIGGTKGKKRDAGKKTKRTPRPRSCAQCPVRKKQNGVIQELVAQIGGKLKDPDNGQKVSIGDYIRLLQVQREIEEAQPREIRVTWVDKVGTGSKSEK